MAAPFTTQDADILIEHAQKAPLRDLKHAEQISQLLQRFQAFVQSASKPAKPSKARKETPAGQSQDPAS